MNVNGECDEQTGGWRYDDLPTQCVAQYIAGVAAAAAAVARIKHFIFDFFSIDWIRLLRSRLPTQSKNHARAMRCLFEIGFGVEHGLLYMAADGLVKLRMCDCGIAGNGPSRCECVVISD